MKWRTYLYEHMLHLLIMAFVIFTIEIFLMIASVRLFIHLYLGISLMGGYLLCLYLDYKKQERYFHLLFKHLEQLDQKYLLPEVLEKGSDQLQRLYKEVLYTMESSMIAKVNLYQNISREYKEYIELWIHEVKTPIATSKMIIENNPTPVTRNINEELHKVENYVEQALFYARSSDVEKDFTIKEMNLKQAVNNVIKRNKTDFINRNIKIELKHLDQIVYSDPKWVEFILHQIIGNAIKYADKPDAVVSIDSLMYANQIRLMIKDNGCGILPQDLNRVFEKGFTGSNQRDNKKATGLGLYLSKKLCERISLDLKIESIKDKYTMLTMIFPVGNMTKM